MSRLPIKLCIVAAGALLLFAEEVGYSVAVQKYALKSESPPFFNGPISAIVRVAASS
jgi:hypothetical protein